MPKGIDISDQVGAYPICGNCGATHVVRDAWAEWSIGTGEWVLKTVFDDFACDRCGESNTPIWKLNKEFRQKRILRLNDQARRGRGEHVTVVVTAGVQAEGEEFMVQTSRTVMSFSEFTKANDPHGEHDFGAFEIDGRKLFWKIDYFDLNLEQHSPDAANPSVTNRVLTIMLASEY